MDRCGRDSHETGHRKRSDISLVQRRIYKRWPIACPRVSARPHIIVGDNPNPFSPAKADCDNDVDHPSLVIGNAVFPGTSPPTTIQTGIPRREIRSYAERSYERQQAAWQTAFPEDVSSSHLDFLKKSTAHMPLQIAGCVSYFIPGSTKIHQTAFVYDLFRVDQTKPNDRSAFDTTVLGEVPPDQLKMERSFLGSFAS